MASLVTQTARVKIGSGSNQLQISRVVTMISPWIAHTETPASSSMRDPGAYAMLTSLTPMLQKDSVSVLSPT